MGDVHWIIDKLEKLSEQRDTEARPSETYAHTASKEFGYTPQPEPATDPVDKEDMATPISREELDKREELVNAKVDARLAHFENTLVRALEPVRYIRSIVLGSAGLIIAVIGVTFTAFDSGRDTAAAVTDAKEDLQSASAALSTATAQLNTAREAFEDRAKGEGRVLPPPAIPTDPPAPKK